MTSRAVRIVGWEAKARAFHEMTQIGGPWSPCGGEFGVPLDCLCYEMVGDIEAAFAISSSSATETQDPDGPDTTIEYGFCGSLDWTVEEWGRVTHKHSCPNRFDPFCQSHPEGCPNATETQDGERPSELFAAATLVIEGWERGRAKTSDLRHLQAVLGRYP